MYPRLVLVVVSEHEGEKAYSASVPSERTDMLLAFTTAVGERGVVRVQVWCPDPLRGARLILEYRSGGQTMGEAFGYSDDDKGKIVAALTACVEQYAAQHA